MGRRIKLDDEIEGLIVAGVRNGLPKTHYCALAGVHTETYNNWMRGAVEERERVRQGERKRVNGQRFIQFSAAVKRARAEWVQEQVDIIKEAAMNGGQWTAAAWLLERRLPGEFGRRVDVGLRPSSVLAFSADELAEAERELGEWTETGGGEVGAE
ncbi:MAG: hypothetical protein GY753_18310 [Gammaproteobacteria bacterium]|nr:hypothetical protein [Gammaproteobacteria bacterium]